ncbi:MAG: endonuclease III domain-containing protein [Thermodesulfobacteriota bacterium]
MQARKIHAVMKILEEEVSRLGVPIVTEISRRRRDPYGVLISTLLSLRTKDETTRKASERLLAKAPTPDRMLRLSEEQIRELIYPVGFYKTKAAVLKETCRKIMETHGGRVPDDLDTLLELKGVGRKTANLVVTLGYGKPGICVDTHVHRISNRLGYVRTKNPEETEFELRKKLPPQYWIPINDYLVAFGQNICKPISPFCSRCRLASHCDKVGVDRHR